MQISTGRTVAASDMPMAMAMLETDDPDDVVLIRGNLVAVQKLGQRVRLGNAEHARRQARRKTQRASRRANR